MKKTARLTFLLTFSSFLSACGFGLFDKDNGDSLVSINYHKFEMSEVPLNMSPEDAKASANQSFSILDDRIVLVEGKIDQILQSESQKLKKLLKPGVLRKATADSSAVGRFIKVIQDRLPGRSAVTKLYARAEDDMLNDLLIVDQANTKGNVIVYTVDKSACEGMIECEDAISLIKLVQRLHSEDAGIFELTIEDAVLLTMGYSLDEWYVEINLAQIYQSAKSQMESAGVAAEGLPDVMTGTIQTTIKLVGAEDIETVLAVVSAIDIESKVSQNESTSFRLGKSLIYDLETDLNNQSIAVKTDMGVLAFYAKGETYNYDLNDYEVVDYSVDLDGVSGTVTLNLQLNTARFRNAGLKSDFVWKENGDVLLLARSRITDFDYRTTVEKAYALSEIKSYSDMEHRLEFPQGFLFSDGPMLSSFSLATDSQVNIYTPPYDYELDYNPDIYEVVEGGPLKMVYKDASFETSITVYQGECANDFDSYMEEKYQIVDCPSL